jgi:hypothetical protein
MASIAGLRQVKSRHQATDRVAFEIRDKLYRVKTHAYEITVILLVIGFLFLFAYFI